MEKLFYLIFLLVFIVWLMYLRIGKGGIIDEVISLGLLEISRRKEEDQD